MRRPRLVYVVTHPVSADLLLRGQLAFMREHGFDVTVIAAPGPTLERVREREGVDTIAVPMERTIDPVSDAVALGRLTPLLRRLAPDIVNVGTPKAGLLGTIAARAANVPVRIYLLRGLRLEGARGVQRRILSATERIACACAHEVVCVSPSLRTRVLESGLMPERKLIVVGEGSSNGVDTAQFSKTTELVERGRRLLAPLGIPDGAPLVGFVGRLNVDKGVGELLDAFVMARETVERAHLLVIGGDLADEDADPGLVARVRATPHVHSIPQTPDLAPYYATLRVLALPSMREGFPNVVLEAASMGVPTVGYRSTGTVDAIEDGVTGALVPQRDTAALADRLAGYLLDAPRAEIDGARARARVERSFSRAAVWRAWHTHYVSWLRRRGLPLPQ